MWGGGGGEVGWGGEVVEKNVNQQFAFKKHLCTKIKLDYIEFDAKINFLMWGWVGVLDFLKIRTTQSNLVKLGLELSLARIYIK